MEPRITVATTSNGETCSISGCGKTAAYGITAPLKVKVGFMHIDRPLTLFTCHECQMELLKGIENTIQL